MPTSSKPPVGAIAFGKSGIGCPVTQVKGDRAVLQTPNGVKRVPLSAIVRWQFPAQKFHPGDRVSINAGNPERFRHHGKVGTVQRFDPKDGTYRIELDDGCAGDWRSEFLQLVVEVRP
jgi:hypothetical protein